jgi:hypothetical protein
MGGSQAQVARRMEELLTEWEATDDRRRIFLDCYARMTHNMLAGIEGGRFEDAAWVDGLLTHFAEYYFEALTAVSESREDAPLVWVHTHRAAQNPNTTALQNLLLGVNAHINFDLVFALVDVLGPEWAEIPEEERRIRYHDHCLVNKVITETVDEVQDQVLERFSPGMDIVDKLGGRVDEWAASWLIARWREEVWERAIEMLGCPSPLDRKEIRFNVESAAMERTHLLLLM